jgi:branched-chain amino acid transport system ATP-binding protein
MTPHLEITGLTAGYGKTDVLHDITLVVEKGEHLGLFGPNGHGKTTLLRTISGLTARASGSVRFDGAGVLGTPPERIARAGLIHVPQAGTLFPDLSVRDTLRLAARAQGAGSATQGRLDQVEALFPRVAERRHQLCRTLSGGERQMVAIGVALMSAPRLLMLDEPTLGLSPKLKEELGAAVAEIAKDGLTLIVVEQDLNFLLGLTTRLVMIELGRIKLQIDTRTGVDKAAIMDHYFGRHDAA